MTQNVTVGTTINETVELLSSSNREVEFMREVTQEFEVEGFAADEKLRPGIRWYQYRSV